MWEHSEGRTPGEGSPYFQRSQKFTLANQQEPTHHACKTGRAYAKNLPLASFLNAAAPSAVSDQGPCPWTLVAFEKAPQNFMRPAALEICKGQRHSVSGRFTWGSCPAKSARLSPKTVKNADSKLSSCAERPSASCRARIAAVVTHIPPEEQDSAKWNTPLPTSL